MARAADPRGLMRFQDTTYRTEHPMQINRTHTALKLALVSITLAALTGCGSTKPKYASAGLETAKANMAMLKSGTEWQMAMQHYQAGDLEKAIKSVDRSLALNPEVAKSHVLRGRILLEMGRLEDARLSLAQAEKLDPNNVDAQYFQGILAERTGQGDQALTRYLKCAELDQSNVQYVIAAAEMHIAAGRLNEAEQLVTSRRASFDNSAAMRQTFGHIAMLRTEYSAAVKHFNDALLLAPKDNRVLEDLVSAQLAAGQHADAEYNLQILLDDDANKERRDLKMMRARCLMAINRPVEARSILQELVGDRAGGRDVRAWSDLGQVAVLLKDRVTLRQAAARVMALAPEKSDGYELNALSLRLQGKNPEALAAIDQAISKNAQNPTAMRIRALVLQDLGRTGDAQAALAAAASLDRNPQSGNQMFAQPDPAAQFERPQ
jgi:tetratricopeptide (TPR) repeat protein